MKVAVVTQYFPNSAAPWAGHSAYQTLRLLAARVDLQVFYPVAVYPAITMHLGVVQARIDPAWQPRGVAATYINYPVLPVVSRPLNGLVMANRLLPHLRAYKPDVVFSYVIYPDGYAAVRIGRSLGVPIVLTAIGSDLNRIPDRLCERFTKAALAGADLTTTVSRDLALTAQRLGADRVRAILNGCDTAIFHPADSAAARRALGVDRAAEAVVYVGRFDVRKGLVELIEAIAALRSRRPALRCYLVGDGPDRPLLEAAILRLAVGDTISLVPACDTSGVAQWMAAASLVTLPSYLEGCPNVIIEALAAGRPVVATRVGGIPELMDDSCGRLVPPRDAAALAEALDQVLGQAWDADSIAARHSRSWQDVADDVYAALDQTLAEHLAEHRRRA